MSRLPAVALLLASLSAEAQQSYPPALMVLDETGAAAGYFFRRGMERPTSFVGYYGAGTVRIGGDVALGVTPVITYGLVSRPGQPARLGLTGHSAMIHVWIGPLRVTRVSAGQINLSASMQW